ncbi:hypothetical protein [Amycolatopsis sulphurea]|uniref:hypothetical protein n=1 Tax=Amycolatopsis sulphurea TaxID=76022 RepID=UPI001B80917F|nr:hypothetical protein [Amycolatopsis sulphurea]
MYSLTMGLQHELGISPVVASFGPGTMAKVKELGVVGFGWNRNSNIVRIIQHGLFCKGYNGANGYGEYSAVTTQAVKKCVSTWGFPMAVSALRADRSRHRSSDACSTWTPT